MSGEGGGVRIAYSDGDTLRELHGGVVPNGVADVGSVQTSGRVSMADTLWHFWCEWTPFIRRASNRDNKGFSKQKT